MKHKFTAVGIFALFIIFQFGFISVSIQNELILPPQIPSSSGGNHWYAGSLAKPDVCLTATHLQVSILTPSGIPNSDDSYYVLLSCFDDSLSYDQIGFSTMGSVDRKWGLTTSYTRDDNGNHKIDLNEYYFERQEIVLNEGTWYTFVMSISNGFLTYELWIGGWMEWSKHVQTDANHFMLEPITDVWGTAVIGFTLYEEVYYTVNTVPKYDFKFQYLYENGIEFNDWDAWYASSPSGIHIAITTYYVLIDNPTVGGGSGGGGGRR
jgi:hypothetical protein